MVVVVMMLASVDCRAEAVSASCQQVVSSGVVFMSSSGVLLVILRVVFPANLGRSVSESEKIQEKRGAKTVGRQSRVVGC